MSQIVSEVDNDNLQTIFILRHGDRYDFSLGKEEWERIAQRPIDPCLSQDVGSAQVVDLHAYFSKLKIDEPELRISKVLTSPFLRCIQTSNPIAVAYDTPLNVENSLWEVVFTDAVMPPLTERACYYPRIDINYKSCFQPDPVEPFPEAALERYGAAAISIENRFMNNSSDDAESEPGIVICTHAAGVVAIVSALMKVPVSELNPAIPCGLYRLERRGQDQPWTMHKDCGQYSTGVGVGVGGSVCE